MFHRQEAFGSNSSIGAAPGAVNGGVMWKEKFVPFKKPEIGITEPFFKADSRKPDFPVYQRFQRIPKSLHPDAPKYSNARTDTSKVNYLNVGPRVNRMPPKNGTGGGIGIGVAKLLLQPNEEKALTERLADLEDQYIKARRNSDHNAPTILAMIRELNRERSRRIETEEDQFMTNRSMVEQLASIYARGKADASLKPDMSNSSDRVLGDSRMQSLRSFAFNPFPDVPQNQQQVPSAQPFLPSQQQQQQFQQAPSAPQIPQVPLFPTQPSQVQQLPQVPILPSSFMQFTPTVSVRPEPPPRPSYSRRHLFEAGPEEEVKTRETTQHDEQMTASTVMLQWVAVNQAGNSNGRRNPHTYTYAEIVKTQPIAIEDRRVKPYFQDPDLVTESLQISADEGREQTLEDESSNNQESSVELEIQELKTENPYQEEEDQPQQQQQQQSHLPTQAEEEHEVNTKLQEQFGTLTENYIPMEDMLEFNAAELDELNSSIPIIPESGRQYPESERRAGKIKKKYTGSQNTPYARVPKRSANVQAAMLKIERSQIAAEEPRPIKSSASVHATMLKIEREQIANEQLPRLEPFREVYRHLHEQEVNDHPIPEELMAKPIRIEEISFRNADAQLRLRDEKFPGDGTVNMNNAVVKSDGPIMEDGNRFIESMLYAANVTDVKWSTNTEWNRNHEAALSVLQRNNELQPGYLWLVKTVSGILGLVSIQIRSHYSNRRIQYQPETLVEQSPDFKNELVTFMDSSFSNYNSVPWWVAAIITPVQNARVSEFLGNMLTMMTRARIQAVLNGTQSLVVNPMRDYGIDPELWDSLLLSYPPVVGRALAGNLDLQSQLQQGAKRKALKQDLPREISHQKPPRLRLKYVSEAEPPEEPYKVPRRRKKQLQEIHLNVTEPSYREVLRTKSTRRQPALTYTPPPPPPPKGVLVTRSRKGSTPIPGRNAPTSTKSRSSPISLLTSKQLKEYNNHIGTERAAEQRQRRSREEAFMKKRGLKFNKT